jgi:hypothetical protein
VTRVLIALALACAQTASEVTLFPLFDPADPIHLSDAVFNDREQSNPIISLELENTTSRPIPTNQIWLKASQFFTPSEMARNGDNVAFSCGRLARPSFEDSKAALASGEVLTASFSIGPDCALDARHVHLFIHVASIGPGPIDSAIWYRDPASFVRLLAAAMPHP